MANTFTLFLVLLMNPEVTTDLETKLSHLGFVESNIQGKSYSYWIGANHNKPFYVKLDDVLRIQQFELDPPEFNMLHYDSGTNKYYGIDKGEWGGGLFLKKDGQDQLLIKGNIKALYPFGADLYVFEGLAHGSTSKGSIYVIRNCDKQSKFERITLLPDAPYLVYLDSSRKYWPVFYIVGFQSFMSFYPDHMLKIQFHNTFWRSLYPNSLARVGDSFLIGMRSGVAVVQNVGGQSPVLKYFVPK